MKVGSKVITIRNYDNAPVGMIGTIKILSDTSGRCGISFHKTLGFEGFHNCGENIKNGYWIPESHLKLASCIQK